jgi:glycolate oxidase FAD binding subunit
MAMSACPTREDEVIDAIADAARQGGTLAIIGSGSKDGIGAPIEAKTLSLKQLSGVVDYDPAELVLTVKPGTLLREVETLIAASGQMLAFEPFDHGPIFGSSTASATIGGVVAAAVAGSQRLSSGGARDHLLGFRAISGRGERFVAGAKVVKNVTGYDLPKLAAGSWGRLFAMTELTLKVLPRPRVSATRVIEGLNDAAAIRAMAAAMGSGAAVAAAAHIPGAVRKGTSLTAFRMQGFDSSVAARCSILETLLREVGRVETLGVDEAVAFWSDMRTLAPLGNEKPLWRINVAPRAACAVIAALQSESTRYLLDWAGGLIWMIYRGDPHKVREVALGAGGHAMLVRADEALRAAIPALHPPATGVAALEERIRRAFDPAGVFETGRFSVPARTTEPGH